MKFNLDEFKNGKVAIYCKNKKIKKDFLQKCTDVGLACCKGSEKPINHCTSYNNIPYCYAYSTPYTIDLAYDTIEFFTENNYKIIEWEIENSFMEDKIDYNKEYSILELIGFPEETEFKDINNNIRYKIMKGNLFCYERGFDVDYSQSDSPLKEILSLKFKLVKKDKKVNFSEAMISFQDGKTIYSNLNNIKNQYSLNDKTQSYVIGKKEILEGEWYIKED